MDWQIPDDILHNGRPVCYFHEGVQGWISTTRSIHREFFRFVRIRKQTVASWKSFAEWWGWWIYFLEQTVFRRQIREYGRLFNPCLQYPIKSMIVSWSTVIVCCFLTARFLVLDCHSLHAVFRTFPRRLRLHDQTNKRRDEDGWSARYSRMHFTWISAIRLYYPKHFWRWCGQESCGYRCKNCQGLGHSTQTR